jgi:hypothetical protein
LSSVNRSSHMQQLGTGMKAIALFSNLPQCYAPYYRPGGGGFAATT